MNDTTEPGSFSRSLLEASLFQPISLKAPNAWCGHLPFAAWLIGQVKPDTFVELGTHTGNSYFTFCQSVKENGLPTRCYAIDTWAGDEHAGYYGDAVFHQVYEHNAEHYSGFGRLLRMTFDDGLEYFADGTVGLLHIDGLHTYDAVKHDFDTWLPKLTPGAVVLFHDTNVRENEFGVWRLWKELSEKYPSMEFLHSHGLGVLQIEGGPPEKRLSWLTGPESQKQMLRDYFAALGARQIERFALHDLKQREHVIMAQRNEFEHHLSRMIEAEEQAREAFEAERDAIREAAHAAEEADRARIQQLEAFVNEILSSKSWRLTAPLRYVVNAFKGSDEKKKINDL